MPLRGLGWVKREADLTRSWNVGGLDGQEDWNKEPGRGRLGKECGKIVGRETQVGSRPKGGKLELGARGRKGRNIRQGAGKGKLGLVRQGDCG